MDEPQDISVHDNFLVSYEVLCERQEIRLRTEFRDRGPPYERTDVIFTGVACYDFEHDALDGTVIFDVEEVGADFLYGEHGERFRAGVNYDWPGSWGESAEAAAAYFAHHGIRGYRLHSSCGMCGWAFARDMRKVAVGDPAT